jgi:hypothetical protein
LNLRPPGPQPEGWGVGEVTEPMFAGFLAYRCCWVALNLIPKLIPKHVFARAGASGVPARGALAGFHAPSSAAALIVGSDAWKDPFAVR